MFWPMTTRVASASRSGATRLGEGRSPRDGRIVQPVDAGGLGGDGNPGVDERVDAGLAPDGGPVHRHRPDLDDPIVRGRRARWSRDRARSPAAPQARCGSVAGARRRGLALAPLLRRSSSRETPYAPDDTKSNPDCVRSSGWEHRPPGSTGFQPAGTRTNRRHPSHCKPVPRGPLLAGWKPALPGSRSPIASWGSGLRIMRSQETN